MATSVPMQEVVQVQDADRCHLTDGLEGMVAMSSLILPLRDRCLRGSAGVVILRYMDG